MEMIKTRQSLCLPEVRRYLIQLCGGVKYLHKRSVLHRDLKIGNLFLDHNMDLKIGDFGLAAILLPGDKRRQTLCGTPNYIAPEILDKDRSKGHDQKVDTWAIGVICFALLTGTPPFASKTQPEIYTKLRTLSYVWRNDDPNYYPQQAKDLVAWCLSLNAFERPEMDDLVEHAFFKMGTIAGQIDSSARYTEPGWLLPADPRGDCVKRGYAVSYDRICSGCGVGKLGNGKARSSTGQNSSKSTIVEVEAENIQGLAPVVPLAPNVIYRHFSEAKESWTATRKYQPILSRKEATTSSGAVVMAKGADSYQALPPVNAVQTSAVPAANLNTSRPSFAATQRQQALPTRTRKVTQPTSHIVKVDDDEKEPRKFMQERPVRAGAARLTRSNSGQGVLTTKDTLKKPNTISEGVVKSQGTITARNLKQMKSPKTLRGQNLDIERAASPVSQDGQAGKPLLRPRRYQEPPSNRSASTNIGSVRGSKGPSKQTNILPVLAHQVKCVKDNIVGSTRSSSPYSTSSSEKDSSWEVPGPDIQQSKPDRVASREPIPGSRLDDLLTAVEKIHSNLRPNQKRRKLDESDNGMDAMVEKWVDYTQKFGLGYILSDGTVGYMMFRADLPGVHKSVLIRGHKMNVIQRAASTENISELPQGCAPVEVFEKHDKEGLQKRMIPAAEFPQQEREPFKMIQLCDRFGRYIANRSHVWAQEEISSPQEERPSDRYVHFFQRLGNVLVWCCGPSISLQFNFPDHTKVNLSAEKRVIELCYYQSNKVGQMVSTCLDPAGFLDVDPPKPLNNLERTLIQDLDIVRKITWIRGVLGTWINEGGAGRLPRQGKWHKPYWPEMMERMCWLTIGLD